MINDTSLDSEITKLIIYKKALYNSDNAQEGDLLLVISTSGNSENLISAVKKAKEMKIESFGLLGKGGGNLKKLVDNHIIIRSEKPSRIQEAHGLVIHILCKIIDDLM